MEPVYLRKIIIGGIQEITCNSLHVFYSQFGQLMECFVDVDPISFEKCGHITFSCVAEVCLFKKFPKIFKNKIKFEVDQAMAARPHIINGKIAKPRRLVRQKFTNILKKILQRSFQTNTKSRQKQCQTSLATTYI